MQSVNIIVGSQMGSAEYVAEQLAEALEQQGIQVQLHEQPVFDDIDQQDTIWLLCTSTYGAGDYPENHTAKIASCSGKSSVIHRRLKT